MSNLIKNNNLTLDSREVAEMVDKNHAHLLRDIETYKEYLGESKIGFTDFFVPGTYVSNQNKELPNYQITKKGCEFIAHKLTGQKGTLFTATYINRFHDMEQALKEKDKPLEINSKFIYQIAQQLEEKEKQIALQGQIIGELKPRADYTDRILKNKGLVTITQIAKDYGMSGQAMNDLLHQLKVQYKQSGQWLLYRDHQGKGYTHSETIDITRKDGTPDIKMNTKWTQKGRLFLYELLKENEVLPDIEKVL